MPLTPLRLAALLACLSCALPSPARADRFERLSKDPKLTRVLLVPQSDLERHDLPPTQRSHLHLAIRGDLLIYHDSVTASFLGVGAPLVSYGNLRWRSLTVWFNSTYGMQVETAASFVLKQSGVNKEGGGLAVGVHAGLQALKSYSVTSSASSSYSGYEDYGYAYYDRYEYTRVDSLYYGLNAHYEFQYVWVELSLDLSDVSRDSWDYTISSSIELTRLGLTAGVAF